MKRCSRPSRPQRGLSLVELLISTAIGLVVVAGALGLFAGQIVDSRRLLLEARLQQDLRAAADVVARDLRRAGYWQAAPRGPAASPRANPYRAIRPEGPAAAALASYSYSRDAVENNTVDSNEHFGVRLSAGAIQLLDGGGGWQQVTDPGTVQITRLAMSPSTRSVSLGHLCAPACTDSSADCPRVRVRGLDVIVEGRSPGDPRVVREVREAVRVRNDDVPVVACP
jgi:type IV pilus assembly protein PilW